MLSDLRQNSFPFLRSFYGYLGENQFKLINLCESNMICYDGESEHKITSPETISDFLSRFNFTSKKFHIEEFSVTPIDDDIVLNVFGYPYSSTPGEPFVHTFVLSPAFKIKAVILNSSHPNSEFSSLKILPTPPKHEIKQKPQEGVKESLEPPKKGWGPNFCPPGLTPPSDGILPKHIMAFRRNEGESRGKEQNGERRDSPPGRFRNNVDDHKQLFVGNLPGDIKEAALWKYFSQFGNVVEARVSRSRNHPNSRPFGFIKFDSDDPVVKALDLRNHYMDGHRINVEQKNSNRGDSRNDNHDRASERQTRR